MRASEIIYLPLLVFFAVIAFVSLEFLSSISVAEQTPWPRQLTEGVNFAYSSIRRVHHVGEAWQQVPGSGSWETTSSTSYRKLREQKGSGVRPWILQAHPQWCPSFNSSLWLSHTVSPTLDQCSNTSAPERLFSFKPPYFIPWLPEVHGHIMMQSYSNYKSPIVFVNLCL